MAKDILSKPEAFLDVFTLKPDSDKQNTTYCPGCGHGILHKLIAEAVSDLGIIDRTTIIAPVGCAVFMYYYYKCCGVQAAHGRAPALGTGFKRGRPDSIVISYQGDGDLAAIGGNNILQAANRGEQMAVIFVNNAVYGMTGGQMAPTTLVDMRTTTSPRGRSVENEGYPMQMCELIATLDAPVYVERTSLAGTKEIMKTRQAIRKALQAQIDNKGFTFVEVLSPCPDHWKISPTETDDFIREKMHPVFERKVFKDILDKTQPRRVQRRAATAEELYEAMGAGPDVAEAGKGRVLTRKEMAYRFSGFGGQGVLSLGGLVAQAGLAAGYDVLWLPSYGPERRGGTSTSSVLLRDGKIDSPLISRSDVLVALNTPAIEKFLAEVKDGGLVVYNSSITTTPPAAERGIRFCAIPATEIAQQAGEPRVANMVMLGAYNAIDGMFEAEEIASAMSKQFKKVLDVNRVCLDAGAEYARKNHL